MCIIWWTLLQYIYLLRKVTWHIICHYYHHLQQKSNVFNPEFLVYKSWHFTFLEVKTNSTSGMKPSWAVPWGRMMRHFRWRVEAAGCGWVLGIYARSGSGVVGVDPRFIYIHNLIILGMKFVYLPETLLFRSIDIPSPPDGISIWRKREIIQMKLHGW